MRNSSLYNKHICDICKKKLLINFNELNNSNNNLICNELKNNNDIHTEFTEYFLYELNITNSNLIKYYNND